MRAEPVGSNTTTSGNAHDVTAPSRTPLPVLLMRQQWSRTARGPPGASGGPWRTPLRPPRSAAGRLAPRAGLLGRHRAQRPRERPRPADGRNGVVAGGQRLPPGGLLALRLRLDRRGVDPGVPATIEGIGVGSAGRGSRLGTDGETFAASAEPGQLRQANPPAARNRAPLRRGLLETRDRRPLRRVAEVHVDAGDQIVYRVVDPDVTVACRSPVL